MYGECKWEEEGIEDPLDFMDGDIDSLLVW